MNNFGYSARWRDLLGVGFLSFLLIAALFPFVLAHPDDYFFLTGGDALQSHYATAFYALHDHGLRFTGMNYPYGEHFNYPNLQPLIALIMNWLQQLGIPTARHTVAITNLLALLGVMITPVVLFSILRRLSLPVGYAIIMALLIGYLSPQIDRLGGHMSLSYTCFVPVLWYCIIRMQENPDQWRWYVIFGISSMLMGLVMLYFLACGCFFLLGHVAVLYWRQPRSWMLLRRMLLAAFLPLLLFRSWLWLTDTVADRPPNPYGIFTYVATPLSVFSPILPPLRNWWQAIFHTSDPHFEGWGYVGLVAAGVFLIWLLQLAARVIRRRSTVLTTSATPLFLQNSLWAASLLLLLSFGLPFILPGFRWLVDYSGPFKQFRSLGRFVWPFYYVFTTYTAYYIYQLYSKQKQRQHILATAWLTALLVVWAGEAWVNIKTKADSVAQGSGASTFLDPNTSITQGLSWVHRQPSNFQAILPLPYFNMGSDKIDLGGSPSSIFQADKISYATGLPQLSSYVSRASVGQVFEHAQLFSSSLIPKALLKKFPSQKPVLLVVTATDLSPAEKRLLDLATPLVNVKEGMLFELPLEVLGATTYEQEYQKAQRLWPTLPIRPDGLRTTTGRAVFYQPFNKNSSWQGRLATGAFREPLDKFSVLYDGPFPSPADTGRYEISVWVNGKTDYGLGNMQVKQLGVNNEVLDHQVADARACTEIDGDWLRMVVSVQRQPGTKRLEVLYQNRDLLADDLLIRPTDTDVYWRDASGKLIMNGYRLQR